MDMTRRTHIIEIGLGHKRDWRESTLPSRSPYHFVSIIIIVVVIVVVIIIVIIVIIIVLNASA
jgi:hypothetical protein